MNVGIALFCGPSEFELWIRLLILLHLVQLFLQRLSHIFELVFAPLFRNLLGDFVYCREVRGLERLAGGDFHVRLDASSFPIRLADGIDGASTRDPHGETRVDAARPARMSAAAGRLANDRRALEVLEVVSEFLGGGEGAVARQDVNVFSDKPFSWDVRRSPPLLRSFAFAPVEIVEVRRLIEEVARSDKGSLKRPWNQG
jgi:hypothetical protein